MQNLGLYLFLNTCFLSIMLLTALVSALAEDPASQLLDVFLATPISSAQAPFQLANTGIDPKLTEINRTHFC